MQLLMQPAVHLPSRTSPPSITVQHHNHITPLISKPHQQLRQALHAISGGGASQTSAHFTHSYLPGVSSCLVRRRAWGCCVMAGGSQGAAGGGAEGSHVPAAAIGDLLGLVATVASVLPVLVWSICWASTLGLIHFGYALLMFMTSMAAQLYVGGTVDYTDLALHVAQQLSSGMHMDHIPLIKRMLLPILLTVWHGTQVLLNSIKPGVPILLFLCEVSVAAASIIFALTLTPLRPLLARLKVNREMSIADNNHQQKKRQQQQQQQPRSLMMFQRGGEKQDPGEDKALKKRQLVVEEDMMRVGQLSLIVLLTAAQASGCHAPPLTPAPGMGPGMAATLFATCALGSDLMLPLLLVCMAGMATLRATLGYVRRTRAMDGRGQIEDGGVDMAEQQNSSVTLSGGNGFQVPTLAMTDSAKSDAGLQQTGTDGEGSKESGAKGFDVEGIWRVLSVAVAGLRGLVDVVLLVAQGAGILEGNISAVRLVGSGLLLRLAWRQLQALRISPSKGKLS